MDEIRTAYLLVPVASLQSFSLNLITFEGEAAETLITISGHHPVLPAVSLTPAQVASFKLEGRP